MIVILLLAKSIIVVNKAYNMCIFSNLSFTAYHFTFVVILHSICGNNQKNILDLMKYHYGIIIHSV